jgi:hypothetical protein
MRTNDGDAGLARWDACGCRSSSRGAALLGARSASEVMALTLVSQRAGRARAGTAVTGAGAVDVG